MIVPIVVCATCGIAFGTALMLVAWRMDAKDEKKRIALAKSEALREGIKQGRKWKYREIVEIERQIAGLEKDVERLSHDCKVPMR